MSSSAVSRQIQDKRRELMSEGYSAQEIRWILEELKRELSAPRESEI